MKLTLQELNTARGFLRQTHMLIAGVSSLFFNVGDGETSARLNDSNNRITDELEYVQRLVDKFSNGGRL